MLIPSLNDGFRCTPPILRRYCRMGAAIAKPISIILIATWNKDFLYLVYLEVAAHPCSHLTDKIRIPL